MKHPALVKAFCAVIWLAGMAKADAAPLAYFAHSAGPAARPTQMLDWVYTGLCIAVCVIVALLLIFAITRQRGTAAADEILRGGEGLRWIFIGTFLSVTVLLGMLIYALVVLEQVGNPLAKPGLIIDVTAYDWWWKADYPSDGQGAAFTTANEIHIPVGVPVSVRLHSADVIHAFWVPDLAGKTQAIPGLTNHQWIQADRAGRFRGQCTQFCGVQHAHMAFEVVAQAPDDFKIWLQEQRMKAAMPDNAAARAGQKIFAQSCAGCHPVRGATGQASASEGAHGPDLTHIQSRRQIAAGLLDNTPENLQRWIRHPQALKPGTRMPDIALTERQEADLLAYLATLK